MLLACLHTLPIICHLGIVCTAALLQWTFNGGEFEVPFPCDICPKHSWSLGTEQSYFKIITVLKGPWLYHLNIYCNSMQHYFKGCSSWCTLLSNWQLLLCDGSMQFFQHRHVCSLVTDLLLWLLFLSELVTDTSTVAIISQGTAQSSLHSLKTEVLIHG